MNDKPYFAKLDHGIVMCTLEAVEEILDRLTGIESLLKCLWNTDESTPITDMQWAANVAASLVSDLHKDIEAWEAPICPK